MQPGLEGSSGKENQAYSLQPKEGTTVLQGCLEAMDHDGLSKEKLTQGLAQGQVPSTHRLKSLSVPQARHGPALPEASSPWNVLADQSAWLTADISGASYGVLQKALPSPHSPHPCASHYPAHRPREFLDG